VDIEFVAVIATVLSDFTQTWSSADDLTVSSVRDGFQVLLTMLAIFLIIVTALLWAHTADTRDARVTAVGATKEKATELHSHQPGSTIMTTLSQSANMWRAEGTQSRPVVLNQGVVQRGRLNSNSGNGNANSGSDRRA
jgi:hypothetical protein